MSEYEAVAPEDELPETPPEAPERPSPPPKRSTRRPATGTRAKARRTAQKKPPPSPEPTPAEAIRGILQIPAAGLIITGQRVESVALVADGATILVHGPPVAEAIQTIAENDPRVMALLEKVLAFGPYGLLLAALMPMTAQFIRNHNEPAAPILEGFGAVPPDRIIVAASLEIPSGNGQVTPDGTPSAN